MSRFVRLSLLPLLVIVSVLAGCSSSDPLTDDLYTTGRIYIWNGSAYQVVSTVSGNVTATGNLGNNTVIRGDGGGVGVQDSLATINDFGTLYAPAIQAGNIDSTGKVEADRLIGDIDGYSTDVVQSSDLNISANDTVVLVFPFEPSIIVLDYSGRCRHSTLSEVGHTTGHSLITRTALNIITCNTNYTSFVNINGTMGSAVGQNDTTNSIVVYGGNDGATDAYLYGVGTWVSATHTLTIKFSTVSDTLDAFNFVEIIATAYR